MMASLSVPLTHPQTVVEVQRAVNRVAIWVTLVLLMLGKEYGREWLETTLRRCLREGQLGITIKAVEAADQGDNIADAALRDVGAELQTPLIQGQRLAPGHLQIIAYLQRVAQRAPLKRGRGRQWHDNFVRDVGICLLIRLAALEFDVPPTRNRENRRADRKLGRLDRHGGLGPQRYPYR